jgi:outer membrane protein OmpA-like peptidoglycan-associated protein
MRINSFLSVAVVSTFCAAASAEPPVSDPNPVVAQVTNQSGQLTYVGSRTRLSIGYDSEFDLVGEVFQVLHEDDSQAWVGTAWLGNEAGGGQINYHWLLGAEAKDDPSKLSVQKVFAAFDRNQHNDQKISAGWGMEKERFFVGAYGAAGISGKRRVSQSVETSTEIRNVIDNGVPFEETWQVTTTTDLYQRAYNYGVGLRAGHFYEEPLIRVTGGADYEWGDGNASQFTLMLGVEKFFRNTPHSLALRGEVYKKSGDDDSNDTDGRILLLYTYHFGEPYRPSAAPIPVAAPVPVKSEISLSSDAFFDFDKSDLRSATVGTLKDASAKLKAAQLAGPINVVGHTCSIGTIPYNQKLSERRARAVRNYLVQQGCDPAQVKAVGRGELDPRYPNNTEASRQKNRRVDIEATTLQEPDASVVPAVAWRSQPAWVERALHNPVDHKRTVDYYQIKKTSTSSELTDRKPTNQKPVARDDAATINQDSPGELINVLANDSDPDGDVLVVERVTQPTHGAVTNSVNGVMYKPSPGFFGTDVFTYVASDGRGGSSNTATVTVTVPQGGNGGQNHPPSAKDDSAITDEGQPVTVSVLANDTDPDGDSLEVSATTPPANGSVANNGKTVTYIPKPGFFGVDRFTYVASDGRGGSSNAATVTVTVRQGGNGGQNQPPNANDDSASTSAGRAVTISVLANDTDPDGDSLTVSATTQPTNGTVTNNGSNVTYTPNPGFRGVDVFAYTASDRRGGTDSANVTVTIRRY